MSEDKWQTVWAVESWGHKGSFKCEVRVNEEALEGLTKDEIRSELGYGLSNRYVEALSTKVGLLKKQREDPKSREEHARKLTGYLAIAGFKPLAIELQRNPYGGPGEEECAWSWSHPKVKVRLPEGHITLHWRKRVIELDWSGIKDLCDVTAHSDQFKDFDVTKSGCSIHAWSEDDAIKYLSIVRQHTLKTNAQTPIFNL